MFFCKVNASWFSILFTVFACCVNATEIDINSAQSLTVDKNPVCRKIADKYAEYFLSNELPEPKLYLSTANLAGENFQFASHSKPDYSGQFGYSTITVVNLVDGQDYYDFAVVYLSKFNGDRSPRLLETWLVPTIDLLGLEDFEGDRTSNESKNYFDQILNNGTKVSTRIVDLYKTDSGYYFLDHEEYGDWVYGGDFIPRYLIKASLKKLTTDSQLQLVCEIERNGRVSGKKLLSEPSVTAYWTLLKNIIGTSYCGFANPVRNVDGLLDLIGYRPWAIQTTSSGTEAETMSYLEDWSTSVGPWSKQIFPKLVSARTDAQRSIKHFIQREFRVDENRADELATNAEARMFTLAVSPPYRWNEGRSVEDAQTKTILEGNLMGELDHIHEWRNAYGESALHLSVNQTKQLEMLLDAGMNPDTPNRFGKTALMYAAQFNNMASMKLLLKHGAEVNKVTEKEKYFHCVPEMQRTNRTVLMYAAENASLEVINELRSAGTDEFITDSQGNYLGIYAFSNRNLSNTQIRKLVKEHINRLLKKEKHPAPSFSCEQASTNIELVICSSTRLAEQDHSLAQAYEKLLSKLPPNEISRVKTEQRSWIKNRNNDCKPIKDDVNSLVYCLQRKMISRLYELRK